MNYKEFGYEYDAKIDEELFEATKHQTTKDLYKGAFCLRSGRDALKAIASEYPESVVLLPALSCDSMINPFESYNCKVVFYRYNKDITIDCEYLDLLLKQYSNQKVLLLFMNYFGIQSIKNDYLSKLKINYPDLVLVNDVTHTFVYEDVNKFDADFTLVSLRKWLNVPDGGLLWAKNKLTNKYLSDDTSFAEKRLKAQDLKYRYHVTLDNQLKSEYRLIFPHVTDEIDNSKIPARMSEYSFQLLNRTDFNFIKETRERNASILLEAFKNNLNIELLQPSSDKSNLYVPFLIKDRDEKQKVLSSLGIYNTIIWPIRDEQKNACINSKYIEEHMLAAPCDQRYSTDDMEYIAKQMLGVING